MWANRALPSGTCTTSSRSSRALSEVRAALCPTWQDGPHCTCARARGRADVQRSGVHAQGAPGLAGLLPALRDLGHSRTRTYPRRGACSRAAGVWDSTRVVVGQSSLTMSDARGACSRAAGVWGSTRAVVGQSSLTMSDAPGGRGTCVCTLPQPSADVLPRRPSSHHRLRLHQQCKEWARREWAGGKAGKGGGQGKGARRGAERRGIRGLGCPSHVIVPMPCVPRLPPCPYSLRVHSAFIAATRTRTTLPRDGSRSWSGNFTRAS